MQCGPQCGGRGRINLKEDMGLANLSGPGSNITGTLVEGWFVNVNWWLRNTLSLFNGPCVWSGMWDAA